MGQRVSCFQRRMHEQVNELELQLINQEHQIEEISRESNVKDLRIQNLQCQLSKATTDKEQQLTERSILEKQLKQSLINLEVIQSEAKQQRQQLDTQRVSLQGQLNRLQEQLKAKDTEKANLEEMLRDKEQSFTNLQNQFRVTIEQQRIEMKDLSIKCNNREKQILEKEKYAKRAEKQLREERQRALKLESEFNEYQRLLVQRSINEQKQVQMEKQLQREHTHIEILEKQLKSEQRCATDLQSQITYLKEESKEKDLEIADLQSRLSYLQEKSRAATTVRRRPSCAYQETCRRFKSSLKLADAFFDANYDMCYCTECHAARGDKFYYDRGEPPKTYGIPVGWCRFGLKVQPRAFALDVFNKWHVAFHGTRLGSVNAILECGDLLIPGDVALGGRELREEEGHFNDARKPRGFDTKQIFVSPSVRYAGHDTYAERSRLAIPKWQAAREECDNTVSFLEYFIERQSFTAIGKQEVGSTQLGCFSSQLLRKENCDAENRFKDPTTRKRFAAKTVLQLCIKPDSYQIGPQTISARTDIDPYFWNKELEWSTKERGAIILYGLLVKLDDRT